MKLQYQKSKVSNDGMIIAGHMPKTIKRQRRIAEETNLKSAALRHPHGVYISVVIRVDIHTRLLRLRSTQPAVPNVITNGVRIVGAIIVLVHLQGQRVDQIHEIHAIKRAMRHRARGVPEEVRLSSWSPSVGFIRERERRVRTTIIMAIPPKARRDNVGNIVLVILILGTLSIIYNDERVVKSHVH